MNRPREKKNRSLDQVNHFSNACDSFLPHIIGPAAGACLEGSALILLFLLDKVPRSGVRTIRPVTGNHGPARAGGLLDEPRDFGRRPRHPPPPTVGLQFLFRGAWLLVAAERQQIEAQSFPCATEPRRTWDRWR